MAEQENKMWGGRFSAGPDAIMEEINASIDFDQKMYAQDIAGSRAHAAMLHAQGILSSEDHAAIDQGLNTILSEMETGEFEFSRALEDIHMNIEHALVEKLGDTGRKLHTGRSRNDQVSTDLRLWMREAIDRIDALLADLQTAFVGRCELK